MKYRIEANVLIPFYRFAYVEANSTEEALEKVKQMEKGDTNFWENITQDYDAEYCNILFEAEEFPYDHE